MHLVAGTKAGTLRGEIGSGCNIGTTRLFMDMKLHLQQLQTDLERAAPKIITTLPVGYLLRGYFHLQTMWRMEMSYYQRKKVEHQAYQWEYAQQKRALGRRKISKAEHSLLEKWQVQKCLLMKMEDLPVSQKAAVGWLFLIKGLLDPQCTPNMMQDKKQAREYFLETRETLQLFCLTCWIEQFQKHVNDFIQEQLAEAEKIMTVLEKEEEDTIHLHGLQHLIAGAIQEEELVQQPDHAFTYAKLDRAIILDGGG
ncbi:hypothetical protein V8E53_013504 [Lactarius tabidus]